MLRQADHYRAAHAHHEDGRYPHEDALRGHEDFQERDDVPSHDTTAPPAVITTAPRRTPYGQGRVPTPINTAPSYHPLSPGITSSQAAEAPAGFAPTPLSPGYTSTQAAVPGGGPAAYTFEGYGHLDRAAGTNPANPWSGMRSLADHGHGDHEEELPEGVPTSLVITPRRRRGDRRPGRQADQPRREEPAAGFDFHRPLSPPAGEYDMGGDDMPSFKWWTWTQPGKREEAAAVARADAAKGEGEDCTYFALMCMLPRS